MKRPITTYISMIICAAIACTSIASCSPRHHTHQLASSAVKAEAEYQEHYIKQVRLKQEQHVNRVTNNIARAAGPLCRQLELSSDECSFKVEIIADNEINAGATGEHIIITTAMLDFINSEDELAYVLGHEFAHNILGHTHFKLLDKGKIIEGFFDAFVYITDIGIKGGVKKNGTGKFVNNHSQAQEQEADKIGLSLMAAAGYNYTQVPNFWRRMSVRHPNAIYTGTTHPTNPERAVALQQAIQSLRYRHTANY